jgi:hypothetical protein
MVAHPKRERSAPCAALSGQNKLRKNFFDRACFVTILRRLSALHRNIRWETTPAMVATQLAK